MFLSAFSNHETLEELTKRYNPQVKLLYFDNIRQYNIGLYNETFTAHSLPDSAEYAMRLIDSHFESSINTAKEILNTIISHQIIDKRHSDYGLFPTYIEQQKTDDNELIHDITSTQTIVFSFFQILSNYKHALPSQLSVKLEQACHRALFSLAQEKYSPHSGCIYLLKTAAIFLVCGTFFNQIEYFNFGMANLNDYYSTIQYNGTFWEYNAPSEIHSTASLLHLIKGNSQNKVCLEIVNSLNDSLWEELSFNYHPGIKKLTGPSSNANAYISEKQFYKFLNIGSGMISKNKNDENYSSFTKCPLEYRMHFTKNNPNHFRQKQVSKGANYQFFILSHIASNYLQPEYALGSFSRCEFWKRHTPLIGFIKSNDKKEPYEFRLRVLCDGQDFSSAELNSIQDNGLILGHIFFNTNRGNLHTNLDDTFGKISASDFRIRFEIKGDINNLDIKTDTKSLSLSCNDTTVIYTIPYAQYSNIPIKFAIDKSDTHLFFDTILDITANQEINFLEMEEAILQFALLISSSNKKIDKIKNTFENGKIITTIKQNNKELSIETPYKPNIFEYMNTHTKQYVNGIILERYVKMSDRQSKQYEFIVNSNTNPPMLSVNDNNFFDSIGNISLLPIDEMFEFVHNLINDMLEKNYNPELFKRYSIHIIMTVFKRANFEYFQFEKNITSNYYDIYQKISTAYNNDETATIMIRTLKKLKNDFNIFHIQSNKNTTVQNVISIIEKNYHNPFLSLTMISEILGLSEKYISKEFKNKTTTNYLKYLTKVRIEKAKELLMTDMDINDIVSSCGYLNISSFRRTFKQHTGMTITVWKKQQT